MRVSVQPGLSRRSALGVLAAAAIPLAVPFQIRAQAPADALVRRRIVLAGQQRMLTQRMSRAATFMALDISAKRHLSILRQSHQEFGATLAALRDGDDTQGLPPEREDAVLAQLGTIDSYWAAFGTTLAEIIDRKTVTDPNIPTIATLNMNILTASDDLMKAMLQAYGNTAADPGIAVAINIAGRQRMLTQKSAKEAALIALGFEVGQNQLILSKTIELFDASLYALMQGLPTITLPPPPLNVREGLVEVQDLWSDYRSIVDQISRNGIASRYELVSIADQADPLLTAMNDVILMYETTPA